MALVLSEKFAGGQSSKRVLKVTLNDPDNLNAMGEEMAGEFSALVENIQREAVKPSCIVLTGAGRAFSAGGNLEMLEAKTKIEPDQNRAIMMNFYRSFLSILDLNIPLVAAVNGHAVGAGLCLAAACDIRIATENAKMGFTFTRLGLHPGMGATFFLPRIVGHARAVELLISGRMLDAAEALRIGLISKLTGADDLFSEVGKLTDEIEACGPDANSLLLETLRRGPGELISNLEREALCQGYSYASAEFLEGVKAAREKRKPSWGT